MLAAGRPFAEGERWYLCHTQPKRERRAEFHLKAQGYRVFVPYIRKTVRHARQLRTVEVPFFPRYAFVALDLNRDRWRSVRSTIGVSSLVSSMDGSPTPVPTGVVESLVARGAGGRCIRLDAELTEGDRVRIMSGPFSDLVGTLTHLDEGGRVQVLLDMMGSTRPINLARSILSPAA